MIYSPFDKQIEILQCTARYIAAISGIQGGKTMTGTLWLIKQITEHPKDDFLIAAPTYKILEQSTLKKFFEIFPMTYEGKPTVLYRKQDSVLKIVGGGNIYIRSTEIPNNIEGMTVRAAWLDEAGLMKPQVWTNVLGRTAIKKGRVLMTSTFYSVNWLYNEVARSAMAGDQDFAYFKWKSTDNPWFPKEEYERAKRILPPAEFERRYNGEPRKMEGLVYPDWDPSSMTYETPPDEEEFKEVIAGVDYGFTNPTAIIVLGITKDEKIYVLDELYQSRLTINEIVKEASELKTKWGIEMFYCDPSAPSLIESLNMNGCSAMAANNDVDDGIIRVQQVMKADRLQVWFGAYNLLEELENYHYKPNEMMGDKAPEFKKKPDKIYDHAVDALRYPLATHPLDIFDIEEKPVGTVQSLFWEGVAKRREQRKISIERYGEDFSEEDREVLDELWIR